MSRSGLNFLLCKPIPEKSFNASGTLSLNELCPQIAEELGMPAGLKARAVYYMDKHLGSGAFKVCHLPIVLPLIHLC